MPVVYTPIPLEEDSGPGLGRGMKRVSSRQSIINAALVTVLSSIVAFIGGFFVGQLHLRQHAPQTAEEKGHLPQAALFPFSRASQELRDPTVDTDELQYRPGG